MGPDTHRYSPFCRRFTAPPFPLPLPNSAPAREAAANRTRQAHRTSNFSQQAELLTAPSHKTVLARTQRATGRCAQSRRPNHNTKQYFFFGRVDSITNWLAEQHPRHGGSPCRKRPCLQRTKLCEPYAAFPATRRQTRQQPTRGCQGITAAKRKQTVTS